MRRKLTPEQEAERQERKAKQRELARTISELSVDDRLKLCAGGIPTIEGRTLSAFNSCFVMKQRDSVTVVGGFQQWKKAGRKVKKGERGLAVWVPIGQKNEENEITERTGFVGGYVFDVEQTEPMEEAWRTNAEPNSVPKPASTGGQS